MVGTPHYSDIPDDDWTDISDAGQLTTFYIQCKSRNPVLVSVTPDDTKPANTLNAIDFQPGDRLFPLTVPAGARVWIRSIAGSAAASVVSY